MKLPQRDKNHVRETASFKIFEQVIPNEWIIREITERDYGIDCYIEICENGQVSGKLFSVQLKSSESISTRYNEQYVVFYGISTESLNYWNLLPVPVLFVYVDIENELVYYLNIKQSIRENYNCFIRGEYKNLKIDTKNILTNNNCAERINKIYYDETGRLEYEVVLSKFLSSIPQTLEFLTNHYCRDFFLPLGEGDDEDFYFLALYKEFKYLAKRMGVAWNVISLKEIIESGGKNFGTGYTFYELYIAKFVHQISPIFLEIINKAYEVICIVEKDFWFEHNYQLWNYMDLKGYEKYIAEIEALKF